MTSSLYERFIPPCSPDRLQIRDGGFLCGIKALKRFHNKPPLCLMVEILFLFRPSFNKYLRIESRPERLTGAPAAALWRGLVRRGAIQTMFQQIEPCR